MLEITKSGCKAFIVSVFILIATPAWANVDTSSPLLIDWSETEAAPDSTQTAASAFKCFLMTLNFLGCAKFECDNYGSCVDTNGDCEYDSCWPYPA